MEDLTRGAKNILATYYQATADEVVHGREWYELAREVAIELAKPHKGLSFYTTAAVISALSPSVEWGVNVRAAETMVEAYMDGAESPPIVAGYTQNRDKAWRILQEGPSVIPEVADFFDPQTAPKTRAFVLNIITGAHSTAVCVDRHAVAIREGRRLTDQESKLWPAKYRRVADDYRAAAKHVGLEPGKLQAITWVTWRRIHEVNDTHQNGDEVDPWDE